MKNKKKISTKPALSIFELIFLVWSGGVLLSIALAILGIFYPSIIGAYLLASVFIIFRLQKKKCTKNGGCPLTGKIIIKKMPSVEKYLLAGLIIFTIFLSSFTTPTIFGGRDEGSISNSALLINRDHGLNHQDNLITTFGTIYGEGKALNFPGFFYQKDATGEFNLKSQFLPGYSSYLANFAYTHNPALLKFANALPLIIFLLAFYLILQQLTKSDKHSILGVILFSSLVPIGLFYKFTLSEIFFASFLWTSLYFLIKYLSAYNKSEEATPSVLNYWMIFIPLLPTVFIRIESMVIIFVLVLILIFKAHTKLQKPSYQTPILLITLLSVFSVVLFGDFFVTVIKGLLSSFISTESLPNSSTSSSLLPKNWRDFYLVKIFYTYNLLPVFLFATLCTIRLVKERTWSMMLPLFLLGVTFIYIIDSNISTDHPWMLRRFVFSIIPLAVLYTIIFLHRYPLRHGFLHTLIISMLIVSNALLAIPLILVKQNSTLLTQTRELSTQFETNDLILVSQKSSGSGWSLISEPLRNIYNKQAIYFFNPADYTKINKGAYTRIYLLVSSDEIALYENHLTLKKVKDYTIKNQLIKPSKNPLEFPVLEITENKVILYEVL